MKGEPRLPGREPDLGPPPRSAYGTPPPWDLTPEALSEAGGAAEEWTAVVAETDLPEGSLPLDVLVDVLADAGIPAGVVPGTYGYRAPSTPERVFVHVTDAARAAGVIADAMQQAAEPEPAGGDRAEREIEELREHDWRQPVQLSLRDGIIIGVLVLAVLLWLASR